MPVNETLARYSDWTYGSAVAVYVIAMVCYAIEQAFGRRAVAAEQARELVAEGKLVRLLQQRADED